MPDRTLITLALATPNIADVMCACACIKRRPTSARINYKTEPESVDKKNLLSLSVRLPSSSSVAAIDLYSGVRQ